MSICVPKVHVSFTKFACGLSGIPSPLVFLAVRKCCFLLEHGVESLSNAKLGLTFTPAGGEREEAS